ncbi:MAG: hypothetical protein WEE89_19225 [Gemmatimonadota bacterium]
MNRLRFYGTFNGTVPDVPRTKPYFKSLTTFEDGRIELLRSRGKRVYIVTAEASAASSPYVAGTSPFS